MCPTPHGEGAVTSKPVRKASLRGDRPELGSLFQSNVCLPEAEQFGDEEQGPKPACWGSNPIGL